MVRVNTLLQMRGALFPLRDHAKCDYDSSGVASGFALLPELDLELDLEGCEHDSPLVQRLQFGDCTVNAENIEITERQEGDIEALATPPCPITVPLPDEFEPDEILRVRGGPHCREMEVRPPKWAKPGSILQLQLVPAPELRIQVPEGKRAGDVLLVCGIDGEEKAIEVPKGVKAGDVFDYTPLALMVAAPEGSCAGDYVVFRHHTVGRDGQAHTQYCRAQVPHELQFGRYFAARLPASRQTAKEEGRRAWSVFSWARH